METLIAPRRSSSLDLRSVAEPQRARVWRKTAGSFFPGLTIRDLHGIPREGSLTGSKFSLGSIWTVLSPQVAVEYRPDGDDRAERHAFSVILQLQGAMAISQQQRQCRLQPGGICLLDERQPFDLEVRECFSHFILMRMPRWMIVDRYPHIVELTASLISGNDPGAMLLRGMLQHMRDLAPLLDDNESDVAFASLVHLLGILRGLDPKPERGMGWRVHAALTLIDARLADTTLAARDIAAAQDIGRRHLDEIMIKNTGISTTAQIWQRRLEKAAADLRNSRFAAKSITEIALGAGFKDAAHFARAFKKRYHCTPRTWRLAAVEGRCEPWRHRSRVERELAGLPLGGPI